jgi:hypothetical protein
MTRNLLGFLAALATAAATTAAPAAAQEPWVSSWYPYLYGNPTDGLTGVIRWQRVQNAPYFLEQSDEKDLVNPLTFRGAVSAEVGAGTLGSLFLRLEARLPGLEPGWRFHALLAGERQGRFGFYGVGSDLELTDQADPNANLYRVHRNRFLARVEVTRTIAGPLRLALGAFFDHTRFTALADSSIFGTRFSRPVRRSNLTIRPALVVDTRDREFTPSRGVLLELGGGFGTAAESSLGVVADGAWHSLWYAQAKGYLSPREGTVLAARGVVRRLGEEAPLSARSMVLGWEREFGVAGADGHRSFPAGALAATEVALVSAEVRHDLLNAGDFGAVTLLAFLDYAHLEDRRASSADPATNQFGGGGGVAIRVLRSAILSMSFATGTHGFTFGMGTGWNF